MSKILGIYHYPCLDGFTAAWIMKNHFEDRIELFPATYGNEPPDVSGRSVFMVDFSYKRPVMEELLRNNPIMVYHLDHHQSSLEDLKGLERHNYAQFFDNTKSGAGIAWDFFFGPTPRPALVNYVEDRDIWAWKLPNSRDINAYIGSFDMTFENWDGLEKTIDMEMAIHGGAAINRQVDRWIKELAAVNTRYMVIGGFKVPVLNVPYFLSSDVGNYLAEKDLERRNAPPRFAATYSDGPQDRKFSLRSIDSGMDVAKIAEEYGGGGHKHASGFRILKEDKENLLLR